MTIIVGCCKTNEKKCEKEVQIEGGVEIKQLKNWMKPKFEPPTWMNMFCHEKYMKIKESNKSKLHALLSHTNSSNGMITRVEFINWIMQELRKGNSEVCNQYKYYKLYSCSY